MKRVQGDEGSKRDARHDGAGGENLDSEEVDHKLMAEVSRTRAELSSRLLSVETPFRTPRTSLRILAALVYVLAGAPRMLNAGRRGIVHLLVILIVIIIIILFLILLTLLGVL